MKRAQYFIIVIGILVACPLFAVERGIRINVEKLKKEAPKNNYALIIGINNYRHWTRLNNAVKDASDLKTLLISKYGYSEKNIIFLKNATATRRNIIRKINRLAGKLTGKDNLLIFYSGHGQYNPYTKKGYWVPVAAEEDAVWDYITNGELIEYLRGINTRHTFIIADSCFSGTLFRASSKRYIEKIDEYKSRQGLTSGRAEVVSDGDPGENSPFARALLTYLRNEDGYITASNLSGYIKENVAVNADQLPQMGRFSGDDGGEFIFVPEDVEQGTEESAGGEEVESDEVRQLREQLAELERQKKKWAATERRRKQAAEAERLRRQLEAEKKALEEFKRKQLQTSAGQEYTNAIGMELVYIPPGEFMMGSPENEEYRDGDETQHRAKITRGFYMGKYEVTVGQWREYINKSGASFDWVNNSYGKHPILKYSPGDNNPIINVSWEQATALCEWLSQQTGKNYRLPTEAEWEYAARGGENYTYAGSNNVDDVAWYRGHSGSKTHPVGQKQPNGFGLYDMSGNVYEWCADWYGDYTSGTLNDPEGPSNGSYRVLRGGGWTYTARYARSANRNYYTPSNRNDSIGFRVVLPR